MQYTTSILTTIQFAQHTLAINHTAYGYKCMRYWQTNNFPDSSAGWKNQDFILSLMAFPYSNICYQCKEQS